MSSRPKQRMELDNQILRSNVFDLQKQLGEAYKRISELIEERDETRHSLLRRANGQKVSHV